MIAIFLLCLNLISNSNTIISNASTNDDLSLMSVSELLEYAKDNNIELKLNEGALIEDLDKKELIIAIESLLKVPTEVKNYNFDISSENQDNIKNNLIQPFALTEYIESNKTKSNVCKIYFMSDQYFEIYVKLDYNAFVDRSTNTRSFYSVNSVKSSLKSSALGLTSYKHLDGWADRITSSTVVAKGSGEFSVSLTTGSLNKTCSYTTTYYI